MNVDWKCRYPERLCKYTIKCRMIFLLDNFCRVKKRQSTDFQALRFSFWKTFAKSEVSELSKTEKQNFHQTAVKRSVSVLELSPFGVFPMFSFAGISFFCYLCCKIIKQYLHTKP